MNNAEQRIDYYDSKDFAEYYQDTLLDSYYDNESDIINRIMELCNISRYEVCNKYGEINYIDRSTAKLIYQYIYDNVESFISKFSGYYVGYTSLESVAFGEQEEQIEEDERQMFEDAGFVVNDSSPEYAYYVVDGGIHIDLLNADIPILQENVKSE